MILFRKSFSDFTQKQPPGLFFKKRCPEKFHKFHRKNSVLESLCNKVTNLQGCDFIKKRLQHRCFPVKCAKFVRTPISQNTYSYLKGVNFFRIYVGVAGGRLMTDVNVGFIVQAFMIYSWTNDTNFFDEIYPFATRAMSWLITESTKGNSRSSSPEVFLGKGVLKICGKFTREHPRRNPVSIKLHSNFIEITLLHGCSPVNLLHIFRTPFPRNTSGWLLLQQLMIASNSLCFFLSDFFIVA